MDKARQSGGFLQVGIKRGGWWTYCPAQQSWDGLVGGQLALEGLSSQLLIPGFELLGVKHWTERICCGCVLVELVKIIHAGHPAWPIEE